MGVVLGWLSTRVLGQYDLLLTEEAVEDQDLVYFVGPNIVALEQLHGFEPREFRLWLALHEVTHRCQFTAIPWMRDYFVVPGGGGTRLARARPVPFRRGPPADDRGDPGRTQPLARTTAPSAWWPPPSSSRGSIGSRL